jgi:predicted component of type VI protein secretion system
MTVSLVTIGKKGVRKEFNIPDKGFVIGRGVDADLRIPTAEVSRSHCEVKLNGNKVALRDLGSSNGTFVNEQKVAQATLKAGDRIRVGSTVFVVLVDGKGLAAGPSVPTGPAPAVKKPVPAAASKAAAPAKAGAAVGDDTDAIDIDEIGDLDIDELSDLNIDDLVDQADDDSGEIEDVEVLEEIDEADLIPDDDDKAGKGGKKR